MLSSVLFVVLLFVTRYSNFLSASMQQTKRSLFEHVLYWWRCVINKVTLRRAWLVLGRVTVCRQGKPSRHVSSHPGQLSLAIPPWVGRNEYHAMSSSKSWGVNGHTARYTSPVSVVSQCKLMSGWGLRKRRSAPPYGPCGMGRTLIFYYIFHISYSIVIWTWKQCIPLNKK